MTNSSVSRKKSKPAYHHGDLEAAAVDAAIEIIQAQGLDAVSMRQVAAKAGVTHGALYQHFDDKRKLLSVVSEEGYRRLEKKMAAARNKASTDPIAQIEALAVAYVFFAADDPAYFRIMSEPDLTCRANEYPPLWDAHNDVVALIVDAVAAAQSAKLLHKNAPARDIAMTLWTFTHGYAETGRTRRGFFHEHANPPKSKTAIKKHLLSVLRPLLAGYGAP